MKRKGNILIVDDDEGILISLKLILQEHYSNVITEKNPNLIPKYLSGDAVDVFILDMNFSAGISSGNEGIYWMTEILKKDTDAVIIFITAYGDVELGVKAIKEGGTDFILKPWENEKILSTVLTAFKLRQSRKEINKLKSKQQHLKESIDSRYEMLTGVSSAMERLMHMTEKVASTDANVLILGENGTGKELIAREIHKMSARSGEVFVNVDLSALTESLFESELFGHKKGSFTDAREDRTGRFEIASGGTLFLDEIGNLTPSLQSKLLTVIQNRQVVPVGSNQSIPIDIRLICATNKALFDMVGERSFREDLLYRINTIQLEMPPLRERMGDIPLLAEYFLQKFMAKYNHSGLSIGNKAMEELSKHNWPGNIRELKHLIEKAVILGEGPELKAEDFFPKTRPQNNGPDYQTLNLEENEKSIIIQALKHNEGNISLTAADLGISRKTLYNKIEKYSI